MMVIVAVSPRSSAVVFGEFFEGVVEVTVVVAEDEVGVFETEAAGVSNDLFGDGDFLRCFS